MWNEVCLEFSDIWAADKVVHYKNNKKAWFKKKKKEYLFIIATDTLGKISSKANKACRTVDSYGYKNITHNKTIIMNF